METDGANQVTQADAYGSSDAEKIRSTADPRDAISASDSAHEAAMIHVGWGRYRVKIEPLVKSHLLFYFHVESGPDSYPAPTGLGLGN